MKRIMLLWVLCTAISLGCNAQLFKGGKKEKGIAAQYAAGAVPVVGNKVMFTEVIEVPGATQAQLYKKAEAWMQRRFAKGGDVLESKQEGDGQKTLGVTSEEYMVFTNKFLNLDRTRINYFVQVDCADGKCTLYMTRIKYWYEEEQNGGRHFTAEEYITDEQCMNKKRTKFYRGYGKFRTKTIDLKDSLAESLSAAIKN